ncbi:TetR/AcrR family transcriptional regulator [Stackebrandtia nassauensis]|uniref:Transcriptional regulator, TetR family n=1 Tax=Stackebrandtia nassauensis (strain DSM 44728 / CIP 108903 / NRRL B-16338 / NBRC 102104 / LLR-40K-21) TaxID=446470 RepID=D3PY50_STANL|nr:TetR/AcrR family transcriptional regulator [Stackebrandtia nassauensis]ADD45379.1 transcriptional regulator, TetR family [Stackebrandtia nassauensis DSM 44728]
MPRPRATTDADILAATGRAIGAHGPAKLTLAHIGAEAGISPATLSQRFGSKRGLLLAFAADAAATASAPFHRARAANDSPLAALHAVAAEFAGHMSTPEVMANHLGMLQLDLSDPEFRVHAAAHTRAVEAALRELITDAVAAGELSPGTDAPRLARAVNITIDGSLLRWALTSDGDPAALLHDDLDHLLRRTP